MGLVLFFTPAFFALPSAPFCLQHRGYIKTYEELGIGGGGGGFFARDGLISGVLVFDEREKSVWRCLVVSDNEKGA